MTQARNGPAVADPVQDSRVLVVGANGFLGSHLVDALVERGFTVRAFDRYSSAPRFRRSTEVELVAGDFLNRADIHDALVGCHTVFHFLSTSTPMTSIADPTFDLRTNVSPTIELLSQCQEVGVRQLFYASSGGTVYGTPQGDTCREDDPLNPISLYGIGKATIESYLRYFSAVSGVRTVSLRIANPYGPRQEGKHSQGLIPIALRAIREGSPVVRFGDGRMVRDYLHVEDLTRMILEIASADPAPRYDVYNLGSGEGVSVSEVLDHLADLTGVDFPIEARPQPATFVGRSVLDISRYRSEWGDPLCRSMRQGLEDLWRARVTV